MNKYILYIIIMLLCSCNKELVKNQIILTEGLSENPSSKRIGIEIQKDKIFYCEEIAGGLGIYNFFERTNNERFFNEYKKDILNNFKNVNQKTDFVDGQRFELIYTFNEKKDTFLFSRDNLTDNQNQIIEKILRIKKLKFRKIDYHIFPNRLLKEKLPTPPPLASVCII